MTDAPPPIPEPAGPPVALFTADPVLQLRLERAARELGAVLLPHRSTADFHPGEPLRALVVDLRLDGSVDAIGRWKTGAPAVPVVAVAASPSPEVWRAAESAGADFVVTRGTAHRRLPGFLEQPGRHAAAKRRLRLGEAKDFEGRLGCVGRIQEGGDDIAVFRVGYRLFALSNACPHAGAPLSEGALVGSIVTCPLHGSQFDVTDGRRTRGPADDAIRTHPVIVDGGDVFVEVEPAS